MTRPPLAPSITDSLRREWALAEAEAAERRRQYVEALDDEAEGYRQEAEARELEILLERRQRQLEREERVQAAIRAAEARLLAERRAAAAPKPAVIKRCRAGHEQTPANVYVTPGGKRRCRVCMRERKREYQAGMKELRRGN